MTEELTVWTSESDWLDQVHHGNCLDFLRRLPDACIDSVVTDPPYALGTKNPSPEGIIAYLQGADLDHGKDFMGFDWKLPSVAIWKEVFRVLKPGGFLLSFGGTRTFDLISIGIRAAGFENRDTISEFYPVMSWVHGQGFAKGGDLGKKLDKTKGATRRVIGPDPEAGRRNKKTPRFNGNDYNNGEIWQGAEEVPLTEPATDEAKKWTGWSSQIKPAWEPILVFRKPIQEKTVIKQVLKTGTGVFNIDGCRVAGDMSELLSANGQPRSGMGHAHGYGMGEGFGGENANPPHPAGRFPSNVILVHSDGCKRVGNKKVKSTKPIERTKAAGFHPNNEIFGTGEGEFHSIGYADLDGNETVDAWECEPGCPVPALDQQSGERPSTLTGRADPNERHENPGSNNGASWFGGGDSAVYADSGGASRFYTQIEQDEPDAVKGRFPSNVILVHAEGCRLIGTKTVKASSGVSSDKPITSTRGSGAHEAAGGFQAAGRIQPVFGYGTNGTEEVPNWECVPGCPVPILDEQSGESVSRVGKPRASKAPGEGYGMTHTGQEYNDEGGASRFYSQFEGDAPFFYCAKANKRETTLGGKIENKHPTKKPLKLMQYLVRLVTPKGGKVLDPYCGSGTTCVAAVKEGLHYVGVELDAQWLSTIQARLESVVEDKPGQPTERQKTVQDVLAALGGDE